MLNDPDEEQGNLTSVLDTGPHYIQFRRYSNSTSSCHIVTPSERAAHFLIEVF